MLPRAFVKTTHMNAAVDTANGLLMVETSSVSKAENFLARLCEALCGLPVRRPVTNIAPETLMTEWLLRGSGDAASVFPKTNSNRLKPMPKTRMLPFLLPIM